jgi:hypothetical protein
MEISYSQCRCAQHSSSHVGQRRGQHRRIRAILRHQSCPCLGYFAGLCGAPAGMVLGREMASEPYAHFALSRPLWALHRAIRVRGSWDLHCDGGVNYERRGPTVYPDLCSPLYSTPGFRHLFCYSHRAAEAISLNGSFAIFPQVQPVKLAREGKIPAVRLRKVVEIPRYPVSLGLPCTCINQKWKISRGNTSTRYERSPKC